MLNWLKRVFAKDEKRQLSLKSDGLADWLAAERKTRDKAFAAFLHEWQKEWHEALREYSRSLDELENAGLHNPNIPERHKAIMTGNRQEFIRRGRALMDTLKTPASLEDSRALIATMTAEVGQFAKGTVRQQAILGEFLRVQLTDVLSRIGTLEKQVGRVGTEINTRFPPAWKALEKDITLLGAEKQCAVELKGTLGRCEDGIAQHRESLTAIAADIARIEQSDEHKAVTALRHQLQRAHDQVRDANSAIVHELQLLDDAIARFARQSTFPLAFFHTLAAAPLDVLENERERFEEMVKQIRKGLADGTIRITDRKKDRAMEACDHLLGAFLDEQITRAAEAKAEEANVTKSINDAGIVARLAQLRKKEADARDTLQRLQSDAADAERRLAAIDFAGIEQRVIEQACQLDIEMTLTQ